MMLSRVLIAVGVIAAMVAIAACGDSSDKGSGSATAAAGGGKKITVIMPSLANDAYLLEKAGAEGEAKRYPDQHVSIVTGAGQSSSELVSKIEDAITRGSNVIAINAGDPKPVIPALKRAVEQGVKVVVFDVPIPELTDQSSFVGLDNRQGGELAGKWLPAPAAGGGPSGR